MLHSGLLRAEQARYDGEPWAEELARRYRDGAERLIKGRVPAKAKRWRALKRRASL